MKIIADPKETQNTILNWKKTQKVGFVPTMGALHEGHLALVRKAKVFGDKVVVSIFVNPLQFGPSEDFDKYPRTFEQDIEKLKREQVDLLFAPQKSDLYPTTFDTHVKVGALGKHFCGAHREGHFDGVATVCLKLFQITQPDFGVFGEKDFQQVRILEQLVADFDLPMEIVRHPTVRESDGLALSSRNRYLSDEERALALKIPRSLIQVKSANREQQWKVQDVLENIKEQLKPLTVEYLAVASETDLHPVDSNLRINEIPKARILLALKIGKTRLIDNTSWEGNTL